MAILYTGDSFSTYPQLVTKICLIYFNIDSSPPCCWAPAKVATHFCRLSRRLGEEHPSILLTVGDDDV